MKNRVLEILDRDKVNNPQRWKQYHEVWKMSGEIYAMDFRWIRYENGFHVYLWEGMEIVHHVESDCLLIYCGDESWVE